MRVRRVTDSLKKRIIIISVLSVFIIIVIAFIDLYRSNIIKYRSVIYTITKAYHDTNALSDMPGMIFPEGTPEHYYLDGLKAYDEKDFEKAESLFLTALDNIEASVDKGLPFCVYYYLNNCYIDKNGVGDPVYVDMILRCPYSYPAAADAHFMICFAADSITQYGDNVDMATAHLLGIIENFPGISNVSKARYLNQVAAIELIGGSYAKSICHFYDALFMLEGVELDDEELLKQKLLANSYIAYFYYDFKDYATAIELFEQNVAFPVEDKKINAWGKYSDYLNLSNCYYEIGNYQKSDDLAMQTLELIPYLEDDYKVDVEASAYNNLAKNAIARKEFDRAGDYLDKGTKLIEGQQLYAFYGTKELFDLNRCRLFLEEGDTKRARDGLEALLEISDLEYIGIKEEVYSLLIECCRIEEDDASYVRYTRLLNNELEDRDSTIRREYLEFSRYYVDVKRLDSNNLKLRHQVWINITITFGVAVLLIISVIFIFHSIKANYTDQLTGIANRKVLNRLLKKYKSPTSTMNCCVAMIDIDFFKLYNDTYGHVKGDDVIKKVSHAIKTSIRKKDVVLRYGGEEFMIFFKDISREDSKTACERVLDSVRDTNIPHEASKVSERVTISLGLYGNYEGQDALDVMIKKADGALYKAKENGRNCSVNE